MSTDYLTEDTILPEGQKFICISFLSDSTKKSSLRGIKLRGAFDTIEKASEHAKKLQSIDPAFNVFVGEMGKWLPFDPEPSDKEAGSPEYANDELNKIMKAHVDSQEKSKLFHEHRKNQQVRENLLESIKTSKENADKLKEDLLKADKNEVEGIENKLKVINEQISKLEEKKNEYEKKELKLAKNLKDKKVELQV